MSFVPAHEHLTGRGRARRWYLPQVLLLIADSGAGCKKMLCLFGAGSSSGMTSKGLLLFPDVLIGRRFLSSIKFLIGANVLFLSDAARLTFSPQRAAR
jgi:hypothetical protein